MNRIMWAERVGLVNREEVDDFVRAGGMSLPAGLPIEGWKRETGAFVEISAERFPGATPVWIWEE